MNIDNFQWLLPLVPGGVWVEETYLAGEREGDPVYGTRWVRATSWPGIPVVDGENNFIRNDPYWYQSHPSYQVMSRNEWAVQKSIQQFGSSLNPNWYEWIILGEYAMGQGGTVHSRRQWIFDVLKQAGGAAGVPANYDWTDALAYASRAHWESSGQPLRWLETPAVYPVHMALVYASAAYPGLQPFVDQTGPGSQLWADTLAAANARRDAHDDVQQSLVTIAVLAVLTMGAAAYFAPAAGATTTGTVAAGTATVEGAELVALVEAGTVGAEGAFLEAAALTGSSVTYSTATGAVMNAITPAGTVMTFDPAVDAYAQFGIEPAQIADATQLPEPAEVTEPVQTTPEVQQAPQTNTFTDKLQSALTQQAKALVVNELRDALADDPVVRAPVAQQSGKVDTAPMLALGLLAGAVALRKLR